VFGGPGTLFVVMGVVMLVLSVVALTLLFRQRPARTVAAPRRAAPSARFSRGTKAAFRQSRYPGANIGTWEPQYEYLVLVTPGLVSVQAQA
jgi:hypothetical protein